METADCSYPERCAAEAVSYEKRIGPKMMADFEELPPGERRDMPQRDAYEKVDYLLKAAGFRQTRS